MDPSIILSLKNHIHKPSEVRRNTTRFLCFVACCLSPKAAIIINRSKRRFPFYFKGTATKAHTEVHATRLHTSSSDYSNDSVEKRVYFSVRYCIHFRLVHFKYIKNICRNENIANE